MYLFGVATVQLSGFGFRALQFVQQQVEVMIGHANTQRSEPWYARPMVLQNRVQREEAKQGRCICEKLLEQVRHTPSQRKPKPPM
jgi:hypothetical protein